MLFCQGAICAAPAYNSPCRRSQTLRRDAALVSRPKERATRPRVLLWVISAILTVVRLRPVFPQLQTCRCTALTNAMCHHRKSVDFSITSSVHSSLPKHLGSISKRPASFSSSHNMAPIAFWAPDFGLTGNSKRNLINSLK